MLGRREKVATWLDSAGATGALLRARRVFAGSRLTALTYHRVARRRSEADRLDGGVVDATIDQLDRQLELVRRHFRVVGIDELAAWAQGKATLPPNPAVITFDDGYLDCHDEVLPLLLEHGLRAVFFVPTDHLTRRRVFWWDRIAHHLARSDRARVDLTYPTPMTLLLGSDAARARSIARASAVVKEHYGLDLDRYLDHLAEAAGVSWSADEERAIADRQLMTWDHARALARAGMDVESHTRTHRVLATLSPRDLEEELSGSRDDVAREIGRPARAIAYPVGARVVGDGAICEALARAGYVLGFTNGTRASAVAFERRPAPFDVGRIAMDPGVTDAFFRSMCALPTLAHVSH